MRTPPCFLPRSGLIPCVFPETRQNPGQPIAVSVFMAVPESLVSRIDGALAAPSRARWVELVFGFVALPLAVGFFVAPVWWMPSLWAIAALAVWVLRRDPGAVWKDVDPQPGAPDRRRAMRHIVIRFVACAGVLALAMILWMPERLFQWPREKPLLWLAIVVLYPLLSAYPQGFLYRRYFFRRFSTLFRTRARLGIASALLFAWMHVIFRNEYALVLTLFGGAMFAQTYGRTGSLRLASFEHALYGNLVFTIGLGNTIYHGSVG